MNFSTLPAKWNKYCCFNDWCQFEPGEGHQCKGQDAECGAHDQGKQGAEHQAHLHKYFVQ